MKIKKSIIILILFISITCGVYAAVKPAMTSFNCGEVSPLMLMRSDFGKYDNSCKTLQNMLPLSQGPVTRRPGTYYIADVNDSTKKARLIPFEYAKTDAYILEFSDYFLRFYRNAGQIVDFNDVIYEITTSYSEEELFDIQYIQLADVMYLVDGTDPVQKLTRYDHDYWTIEDANYTTGPFLDEYVASARTGITVNYASSANGATASETGTTKGTSSGAVANTNDDDYITYWKRLDIGEQAGYWDPSYAEAEFTIEIPFSNVDELREVKYNIGWYNVQDSGYGRSVSCQIKENGSWIEIGTSTGTSVTIKGQWFDVNDVKIHLYTYSLRSQLNKRASAGAILYELEAWGVNAETSGIVYFSPSNTETYNRTLDNAAAEDLGGTPNKVRVPSTAHGFLQDDYVIIDGTTNYDGTYKIPNVNDVDTFDIEHAFTAETFAVTDTAKSRICLTATKDSFNANHIGSLWKMRHPRTDATLSGVLDANESSATSIDCQGDFKLTTHGTWTATVKLEKTRDGGTTWETVSGSYISSVDDDNIIYSGNESEVGYEYRVTMTDRTSGSCTYNFVVYDHMHTGVVRIASYVDPNEVTATVLATLGGTSATTYWSEGYWSPKNGYPETIEFHEFRLWYGGNLGYPQTIWASRTEDYDDMTAGTEDDSAIIYTLPSQNPIQWLLSQSYLMIGTLGGAGRLGDPDEAMTPTTQPQYHQQSKNGSAYIQAIMAGDAILYVERGGKKVREFVYAFERDKFVAPDMTVLAEHITTEGIVDIAYQSRPDSTLWCVLEDGNTATLTYNREQDVVAWATHSTEGDFESVAVIPGEDEDEIWFLVNRTVDSNSVRYIEQMQPRNWGSSQSDCFFVDSGLTFDGGDAFYISDVNQTDPAFVTVPVWPTEGDGTNLADGDQIKIIGIIGMTELNGNIYTIDDANVAGLNFTLDNSAGTQDVNSIDYTAYISGGTLQRYENSFSGFGHLESETLKVLADGKVQTDVIVDSNAFTISIWANKVHAGLPYNSILETMPIVFTTQEGSVAASNKRVSEVAINFYESLGTKYGREGDTDECFTESSLVTDWKNLSFQHGYTKNATIYLEQEKPLPLCVRAIIPTVTVTE